MSEQKIDKRFIRYLKWRRVKGRFFAFASASCLVLAIVVLALLLTDLASDGSDRLGWSFLSSFPSRFAAKAGIKSALVGSLWLMLITMAVSVPLGIGSAVYLEEYAPKRWYVRLIEINIANLAGVPSIVYGILGLAVFVRAFSLGRSLLAGGLTMALLILPVIIISAREAIRAVPKSLREASLGLGATKWQTIQSHVLPSALPGIMTGVILSMSRAIGETAPLLIVGALGYVAFLPSSPMDAFTVLPVQIYNWASRPQPAFHDLAATGILVLLFVLLSLNGVAIMLRHRFERKMKW